MRVEVGDDDVARTGVASDGHRHAADRAGARDEHVLSQDREGQGGVDGIAQRIEDRGDLVADAPPVVPDVGHRQRDVLRERAGTLHAEPDRVGAEVAPPGHAVPAAPADDVTLAAHPVARAEVAHVRPHVDDLADELVPDHQRHRDRPLRPRVPAVDVDVRPADPGPVDANEYVVDPYLGLGHVLEPEAGFGAALDEGLHPPAAVGCRVSLRVSRRRILRRPGFHRAEAVTPVAARRTGVPRRVAGVAEREPSPGGRRRDPIRSHGRASARPPPARARCEADPRSSRGDAGAPARLPHPRV